VPAARILIAAILALAGLTACGDDAGPEPAPLEAAAPTEPPTPTSSTEDPSPVLPAEARKPTPDGAKALLGHWVQSMNYAVASGNVRPVQRISSPACASCTHSFDTIRDIYRRGGHIETKGWTIRSLALQNISTVSARIHIAPQQIWTSPERLEKRVGAQRLRLTFRIEYVRDGWRVREIEL
jgi:hypothetical protein